MLRGAIGEAAQDLVNSVLPRLARCRDVLAAAVSENSGTERAAESAREQLAMERVLKALARARDLLSNRCKALFVK